MNESLKKRFNVTSIGELQTPNKSCGVAKIKRIFREKLEDSSSLVEILHLSIHFLYLSTISISVKKLIIFLPLQCKEFKEKGSLPSKE
ncbi:hypothetical protein J2Y02_003444 [Neobacillus drentensis]|nr:hypothetical protein [Neobacillus drentensis]